MSDRLKYLYGIFGFSVLIIMVDHYFFMEKMYAKDAFPFTFFRDGLSAIFILFVSISYYVAKKVLLLKDEGKSVSLIKFYIKRLMIIIPPLYAYLLILKYSGFYNFQISDESYFSAFTFLFNYTGMPHKGVIMHYWAFCAEETMIFSLIPIVIFFNRTRALYILLIIALASIFMRAKTFYSFPNQEQFDWYKYMQTHLHFYSACFGMMVALLDNNEWIKNIYQKLKIHWMALVVLIIISPYLEWKLGNFYMWLYKPIISSLFVSIYLLFLAQNKESIIRNIFSSRVVSSFGLMYFSLYIWQQPFTFVRGPGEFTYLDIIKTNSMALVVAFIAYLVLERPFKKLSERIDLCS